MGTLSCYPVSELFGKLFKYPDLSDMDLAGYSMSLEKEKVSWIFTSPFGQFFSTTNNCHVLLIDNLNIKHFSVSGKPRSDT